MRVCYILEGVVATMFNDPHAQEGQGESQVCPIVFQNWIHPLALQSPCFAQDVGCTNAIRVMLPSLEKNASM